MTKTGNATFEEISSAIRNVSNILVLTHQRPDGDAIGSQLAMLHALEAAGKTVTAWNHDPVPKKFHFLPGADRITLPPEAPQSFDLTLVLDNSDRSRVGSPLDKVAECPVWINIDHHVTNGLYGQLNFIDPAAPATGEIIHDFLAAAGFPITPEIAAALYVAISTDTGSFQYASTTPHTMEVGAALMRAGADIDLINQHIYSSYPLGRVKLLHAVLGTMELASDDRIASIALTRKILENSGARREDTEGIIDSIRSIDTVELAMIFEEVDESATRVSMRSKSGAVDVARFASQFGGGGHPRAAGARLEAPLSNARTQVLAEAAKLFQ